MMIFVTDYGYIMYKFQIIYDQNLYRKQIFLMSENLSFL